MYLLDPPLPSPQTYIQIHPQRPPPLEGSHTIRFPCFSPPRWISSKLSVPHLSLSVSATQMDLPVSVCVCEHLDGVYPWRWLQSAPPLGAIHQWLRPPHRSPPVLQLQLWPVFHSVGQNWGLLQAPQFARRLWSHSRYTQERELQWDNIKWQVEKRGMKGNDLMYNINVHVKFWNECMEISSIFFNWFCHVIFVTLFLL